ncbi:MAG: hypothetical protein B7Z52_07665, partial [Burkholderiales bacterium 12-64-5]
QGAVIAVTGTMVVVVVAQVILRYGFGRSFDWADEISRLLFVWVIFLALPLGIPKGAHVGVSLLTDRLPPAARSLLFRLTSLMCAALLAVVAWQAALLVLEQWEEPLSTLDASVALFMVPLVLGAAHGLLHLLALAVAGAPAPSEFVID